MAENKRHRSRLRKQLLLAYEKSKHEWVTAEELVDLHPQLERSIVSIRALRTFLARSGWLINDDMETTSKNCRGSRIRIRFYKPSKEFIEDVDSGFYGRWSNMRRVSNNKEKVE